MWRKRHLFACWLLIVVMTIGAVVSIAAGWPGQFGGRGDPGKVASEFFSRGTALAPPFGLLLLFAVFAVAARRDDRWGMAAVIGTMALSVLFIIGSIGEALAAETPDVPRQALIGIGIVGTLVSGGVLVTGLAVLQNQD